MRIAISGATGFIGKNLLHFFNKNNIETTILHRFDFENKNILHHKILSSDCIINLAGESISKRWTSKARESILSSRIDTTRQIVEALNTCKTPKIFISASAVGIYPYGGEFSEYSTERGDGFLAQVCQKWENEATKTLSHHRTLITRFGVVLGYNGGALPRMMKSLDFCSAVVVGSGKQSFSWIAIDDLVRAMAFLINNPKAVGVFNFTSPEPTTNLELTKQIASKGTGPLIFKIPFFVFRLFMGKSSELLSKGSRVLPNRLLELGFEFKSNDIKEFFYPDKK